VQYSAVYNECTKNTGDNSKYCVNGASVGVSLASNDQNGTAVFSLTNLGKSSVVVVRIDYIFYTCNSPIGDAIVLKSYTIGTGVAVTYIAKISFSFNFTTSTCLTPSACTNQVLQKSCGTFTVADCSCDRKRQADDDDDLGVVSTPTVCASYPCEEASCDEEIGCRYTPFNCDDFDPCTNDSCDPTIGDSGSCVNTPKHCLLITCVQMPIVTQILVIVSPLLSIAMILTRVQMILVTQLLVIVSILL